MFAIVEKCHDIVTLQYKTRRISSIRIDAQMELVRNTAHYAGMTADMAFLSSESLSLRLCTSAETCLKHFFFSSISIKRNNNPTDRANGLASQSLHKRLYFLKRLKGECTVDRQPEIHVFINLRP